MPNGEERKPLELPKFPKPWSPEDEERLKFLEELKEEQQRIYMQHFTPVKWKGKTAVERWLRDRLAAGWQQIPLEQREPLLGRLPWTTVGISKAHADRLQAMTEREVEELQRRQLIAQETPNILDNITRLALGGKLTDSIVLLRKTFPLIDPDAREFLDLTEEEQEFFEHYALTLLGKSKGEIEELYYTARTPSIPTITDLDIKLLAPTISPAHIMTTVAFAQGQEQIQQALQTAYPPQVEKPFDERLQENLEQLLEDLGLKSTGDLEKDLELIKEAEEKRFKEEGYPITIRDEETGISYRVNMIDDTIWREGELIGVVDRETNKIISLPELIDVDFDPQLWTSPPEEGYPFPFVTEEGEQLVLTFHPDDMTIRQDGRRIAQIQTDGKVTEIEPELWRKILGGAITGLNVVLAPFEIVGAQTRQMFVHTPYPDDILTLRVELSEETKERLERLRAGEITRDEYQEEAIKRSERYEADVRALGYESTWQARNEATARAWEETPWWEKLLWELPAWAVLWKTGISFHSLRAILVARAARPGVAGIMARIGAGVSYANPLYWIESGLGLGLRVILTPPMRKIAERRMNTAIRNYLIKNNLPSNPEMVKLFTNILRHSSSPRTAEMIRAEAYKKIVEIYGAKAASGFTVSGGRFNETIIQNVIKHARAVGDTKLEIQATNFLSRFKAANLAGKEVELMRDDFFIAWMEAAERAGFELMDEVITKIGSMAAKESERYFPAAYRTAMSLAEASPASHTLIIDTVIPALFQMPVQNITAEVIANLVGRGVLPITGALVSQLRELGVAQSVIDKMTPEEAWATLFQETLPPLSTIEEITKIPDEVMEDILDTAGYTPDEVVAMTPKEQVAAVQTFEVTGEAIPSEVKPTPAAVKKANKEIKALGVELSSVRTDLDVFRSSYQAQVKKAAELPALEAREVKEVAAGLRGEIDSLTQRESKINARLEELRKPVAPEVPLILEAEAIVRGEITDLGRFAEQFKRGWTETSPKSRLAVVKEAGLSVEVADKAYEDLTLIEKRAIMGEYVPRVTPEVKELISKWEAQSLSEKTAWANKAGIAKTAAKLPWDELTGVQQERLLATPVPAAPLRTVRAEKVTTPDQIAEGEHISTRAKEQSVKRATEERLGVTEFEILPETIARYIPEEAEKIIKEILEWSDPENPLHHAAVSVHASEGEVKAYIDLLDTMPKKKDGTIDWDANIPPVAKDSKLGTEPGDLDNVSEWKLAMMQPEDAAAAINAGWDMDWFRMKVVDVAAQFHKAYFAHARNLVMQHHKAKESIGWKRPAWVDHWSRKEWNENQFYLNKEVGFDEMAVANIELLEREKIAELLKGYPTEIKEAKLNYAKHYRGLLEEIRATENQVRRLYGLPEIGYVEDYMKEMVERNIWSQTFGSIKHFYDQITKKGVIPDWVKSKPPFIPHAEAREGGIPEYLLEKDPERLLMDYIDYASRDIFFTPVVLNMRAYIKLLNEKGAVDPASWLESWSLRWSGIPNALDRRLDKTPLRLAKRPAVFLRARLNEAVFAVNLPWNLFVQPSSTLMSNLTVGSKYTLLGLQAIYWKHPEAQAVWEGAYSYIIKQYRTGSVSYQDIGSRLARAFRESKTPIETAADASLVMTRSMELLLNRVSIYAGYLHGKSIGLKGAELRAYAAGHGAKIQSAYDYLWMPQMMTSRYYSSTIGMFQTFVFTAFTRIMEMPMLYKWSPKFGAYRGIKVGTGAWKKTVDKRIRHLIAFIAGLLVINEVSYVGIGRRPWQLSSFLPSAAIVMGGLFGFFPEREYFDPRALPLPGQFGWQIQRAINAWTEYGNYAPFFETLTRYMARGGLATVRAKKAFDAILSGGEVKDITGERLFEMEPEEFVKAVIFGVYSTESGREYRERVFDGMDMPTQYRVRELTRLEDQLGKEIEGRIYRLGDYRTDFQRIMEDEPLWKVDTAVGYSDIDFFAARFELFREWYYDEIPADQRIALRERNPEVDAMLYFWGLVGGVRTIEAQEKVRELFEDYGVYDAPLMHPSVDIQAIPLEE